MLLPEVWYLSYDYATRRRSHSPEWSVNSTYERRWSPSGGSINPPPFRRLKFIPSQLYTDCYWPREGMENHVRQQLGLFGDRLTGLTAIAAYGSAFSCKALRGTVYTRQNLPPLLLKLFALSCSNSGANPPECRQYTLLYLLSPLSGQSLLSF